MVPLVQLLVQHMLQLLPTDFSRLAMALDHVETGEAVAAADRISPYNGTFSDLEELLQNRLPIDITQADLPLRIALFGNPAGPRRLRVDAAHPQVATPHMMTSARKKQQSKPAVPPASDSDGDDAISQPADMAAANADYERFDRALDLLEGQSDA